MSFYGYRASQMGAPIFQNPRMAGFGRLPSASEIVAPRDASEMVRQVVELAKSTVFPGGVSTLDALIRQAWQIENDAGPYISVSIPGVTENALAGKIKSIETNLQTVWSNFLNSAKQVERDVAGRVSVYQMQHPNIPMDIVRTQVGDPLRNALAARYSQELGSLYQQYVDEVPKEIQKVKEATQAANAVVVTSNQAAAAKQAVAAAGSSTEAFVAQTKLDQAMKEVAAANARAESTAKAVKAGPSALVIGAVAVPVIGVIAYAFLKKGKKSSVSGYRRRSRR